MSKSTILVPESTIMIPVVHTLKKMQKEVLEIVDFGKRLKALRLQAGLTQKQLGALIGVTKSVVSFYELQERSPSPDVLIKLAAIFHVSTDYLLGIEKMQSIDISGLEEEDIKLVKLLVKVLQSKNKKGE